MNIFGTDLSKNRLKKIYIKSPGRNSDRKNKTISVNCVLIPK